MMKGSKLLMTLLVVVLILSFTITTVGAQSQVGQVDEDGDLIVGVFPQVNIGAKPALMDVEQLTGYIDFAAAEGLSSADSTPLEPVSEYVYTKYPKLWFSEDPGATKYQIEVYDISTDPDVLVYSYKGTVTCTAGECKNKVTTALKPLTMFANKGIYSWHVRSKTASGWGAWSAPVIFVVCKTGFDSPFTVLDNKWYPMTGVWLLTSAGYAKTIGEPGVISSAQEKHLSTVGYVYEAKMKRKADSLSPDYHSLNFIYFDGLMKANDSLGLWNGYHFGYRNDGFFSLWRRDEGAATPLIDWTESTAINSDDWNKLTVFTDYPYVDLWINGQYLGFSYLGDDSTIYTSGFVGLEMFEIDADKTPLLVDWARLYYTTTAPYPWPWSAPGADGVRDSAYELTPAEGVSGGSEFQSP
jgi:hypothetical protein